MPGPWLTALEVKDRLASILELAGGGAALPAFWDPRIAACQASAWKAIRAILVGRGFTAAQLDTWDERKEYEGDISAAFCLRDGVADQLADWPRLEGDDRDFEMPERQAIARHLDRRSELYELVLIAEDGTLMVPEADPGPESVGLGLMRKDDVFREPCAPPLVWYYGQPRVHGSWRPGV